MEPSSVLLIADLSVKYVIALSFEDTQQVIDGRLDDPIWKSVQITTDSQQEEPGEQSSRTEVASAYDDECIERD